MGALKNLAISTVATAPSPATSGTTLTVAAGQGSRFPTAPFQFTSYTPGVTPDPTNAEICLCTSKGSGDNWTIVRADGGTSARSILVNDIIELPVSAKVIADATGPVCDGRLTLTSGTPITTGDVTGATQVYFTPFRGNRIALYDGSVAWTTLTFSEITIALGTLTSGLPYDVFAYNNAGVVACEILAWTSATARATALVLQDGVLVKSGATTRRYVGTFCTTSTTATEDSAAKRLLWNYYNRQPRTLQAFDTTGSWTYTTATLRQARASAANQVAIIVGVAEDLIDLALSVMAGNNSSSAPVLFAAIGEDSTTVNSGHFIGGEVQTPAVATNAASIYGRLAVVPAIGYHYYAWLEYSSAVGTTTWYSTNGPTGTNAGLLGAWRA